MEWSRLVAGSLLTSVILLGVGTLFHFTIPVLAPQLEQEYRNAALFRPWEGWTRLYMLVHPLLYGWVFATVFLLVQAHVGTANLGGIRDGLAYGIAVFIVGSLPIYALNFASFSVSAGVVLAWIIQSLCQYAAAGLVLGWCCGRSPG